MATRWTLPVALLMAKSPKTLLFLLLALLPARAWSSVPGDCSSNAQLGIEDITAVIVESTDDDGQIAANAGGGTHPGDPGGCDANGDRIVDMGDLACVQRLLAGQTCQVIAGPAIPWLEISREPSISEGRATFVVTLDPALTETSAVSFTFRFDPALLEFQAISVGSWPSVSSSPQAGVWKITTWRSPPFSPDGLPIPLFELTFRILDAEANLLDSVSLDPQASFGNQLGQSLKGFAVNQRTESLVLFNSGRLTSQLGAQASSIGSLEAKLEALSQLASALTIDVTGDADLDTLYLTWDDAEIANDVRLANEVVLGNTARRGLRGLAAEIAEKQSGIKSLLLIGDDRIFPMTRIKDLTPAVESRYLQFHSLPASKLRTALEQDFFLSDDPVGAILTATENAEFLAGTGFVLPTLAVGRLVEHPSEMEMAIDGFLATGGSNPTFWHDPEQRLLITGSAHLKEGAAASCYFFSMSRNHFGDCDDPSSIFIRQLVADWGADPVASLRSELQLAPNLMILSGQGNHLLEGASAPDPFSETGILSTELYGDGPCQAGSGPGLSVAGSVILSFGSHSGLSVPGRCPDSDAGTLDLPQTYLRQGALAYIANTGYTFGLHHGEGLTESLPFLFSTYPTVSYLSGSTLGEMVRYSKERLFQQSLTLDALDRKALMQLTTFGFPMTRHEPTPIPVVSPEQPDVFGFGGFIKYSAQGVQLEPDADCSPANQPEGCYLKISELDPITSEAGLPIQPLAAIPVLRSLSPGVLWLGGQFRSESPWQPVLARPASSVNINTLPPTETMPIFIKPRGIPPLISAEGTGACSQPTLEAPIERLLISPAMILPGALPGSWNELAFSGIRLEFVNEGNSSNCIGPHISHVSHGLDGSKLGWNVTVDSSAAGQPTSRVVVVYKVGQLTGEWLPVDLAQVAVNGAISTWTGFIEPTQDTVYFVQAVDQEGNVSWFDPPNSRNTAGEESSAAIGVEVDLPDCLGIFCDGFESGDCIAWQGEGSCQ